MRQWTPYFRSFTQSLGSRAPASRSDAAGNEVPGRPALGAGIAYDHKGNTLEVALGKSERLIYNPRTVWVEEDDQGALLALTVERDDGTTETLAVR